MRYLSSRLSLHPLGRWAPIHVYEYAKILLECSYKYAEYVACLRRTMIQDAGSVNLQTYKQFDDEFCCLTISVEVFDCAAILQTGTNLHICYSTLLAIRDKPLPVQFGQHKQCSKQRHLVCFGLTTIQIWYNYSVYRGNTSCVINVNPMLPGAVFTQIQKQGISTELAVVNTETELINIE